MANHPNRSAATPVYGIWCETNYYQGTLNAREPHWVDGRYGDVILLASKEEAERLAEMLTPRGTYVLAHGQYAAPDYQAKRYRRKATGGVVTLRRAMCDLGLQYDFNEDGTRKEA